MFEDPDNMFILVITRIVSQNFDRVNRSRGQ